MSDLQAAREAWEFDTDDVCDEFDCVERTGLCRTCDRGENLHNGRTVITALEAELTALKCVVNEARFALIRERTFHPDLWAWPDRNCPQCHALQILDTLQAVLSDRGGE